MEGPNEYMEEMKYKPGTSRFRNDILKTILYFSSKKNPINIIRETIKHTFQYNFLKDGYSLD